jgi:hypothetical protein
VTPEIGVQGCIEENVVVNESIKRLMRRQDNLDQIFDEVVNFSVKVMHLRATTLHFLHVEKDKFGAYVGVDTMSSLYWFLAYD